MDDNHEWLLSSQFRALRCFAEFSAQEPPPSIPFVSKVKKMDKVDGPDADKSEWIKLEFLMDPYNPT
jgi:hypothetical protein